jgi:beta-glucosidase
VVRADGLLPGSFRFGVATAGYQIEGGFNGPGEPANNWRGWERSGRVEPSGIACDFWNHPEEALDRAASIGVGTFRLSVEWARLEPHDGEFDESALDTYQAILTMCHERGLQPVVTLHHFTHPDWLGGEFWLTPGSPDRFAAHVARIVPSLAGKCAHWVTINEPNVLALGGWVTGMFPPGRRFATADAWCVVDNLLAAHVLAHREIHAVQRDAVVTVNTGCSSLYDYDRLLIDLLCARALGIDQEEVDAWIDERRAVHDAVRPPAGIGELWLRRLFAATSPYGSAGAGVAGLPGGVPGAALVRDVLRRPSPRRVVDLVYEDPDARPLDLVGLDWYDPSAAGRLRVPGRRTDGGRRWVPDRPPWEDPPDPEAMAAWCHEQAVLLPDVPIWLVENGMCTRVRNGRSFARADHWDRQRYLRDHLRALVGAVEEGAPITGYLHWSLMDNYEWGSYEPRFGLFGIDRSRGPRGVRWMDTDAAGVDAAGAYRELISAIRSGDRAVLESR